MFFAFRLPFDPSDAKDETVTDDSETGPILWQDVFRLEARIDLDAAKGTSLAEGLCGSAAIRYELNSFVKMLSTFTAPAFNIFCSSSHSTQVFHFASLIAPS